MVSKTLSTFLCRWNLRDVFYNLFFLVFLTFFWLTLVLLGTLCWTATNVMFGLYT